MIKLVFKIRTEKKYNSAQEECSCFLVWARCHTESWKTWISTQRTACVVIAKHSSFTWKKICWFSCF